MTVGIAASQANGMLDALCRNVSYANSAVWIKLHVGDPGSAGTSNAATETTRKQATFGNAASAGSIANTVALTWTNVAGTEDYTHFSMWTASTAGTFLGSGTVTANAVAITDDFAVAIGALTVPFTIAS